MPTRAQKAAAEKVVYKAANSSESQSQPDGQSISSATSNLYATSALQNGSMETIGSRLRKRRRTDSASPEHALPALKRFQSKKAALPISQRGQGRVPSAGLQGAPGVPKEDLEPSKEGNRTEDTAVGEASAMGHQSTLCGFPAQSRDAPDFNAVIADIINHGETVDNHYATHRYDMIPPEDNGIFHPLGASFNLKSQSLPVLENLATQILEIMAKSTYHEILTIATKMNTDPGQAYATLKSLFDHTKKVYSVQEPFLDPFQLRLVKPAQISIVRKANMATFVSSVFGSQDVGFYHLNENFLDTFAADGSRLLKSQAQLLLELKTQAYISAVQNTDRSKEEILEDLFPHDLGDRLLKRRPGAKQIAPSEADFVQRAQNRRKALSEEAADESAITKLPDKYVWEDFLRDISNYVSKNFEAIAGISAAKSTRPGSLSSGSPSEEKQQQQQCNGQRLSSQQRAGHLDLAAEQLRLEATWTGSTHSNQASCPETSPPVTLQDEEDIDEKATKSAHHSMQNCSNDQLSGRPAQFPQSPPEAQALNTPQIEYHFEHPLHPNVPAPPLPYFQDIPYQHPSQVQPEWGGRNPDPGQLHRSYADKQVVPYPTQSAPTQILYERARMAATAKASPNNRRAGHPSQRRPWTMEEESSLMAGLDRVKGPHWSQILAMFGPGGTINEILKDRNQVQLKDKARNLKLFFLKSGIEVPYYLQFVTGELKTRAPAQAARNEAKRRNTTDEDRAHVEGLMALAAGSSHEVDHMMTSSEDQQASALRSGHVPMADMGHGDRGGQASVPIDPTVSGDAAVSTEGTMTSADVSMDGIKETILAKPDKFQ